MVIKMPAFEMLQKAIRYKHNNLAKNMGGAQIDLGY